MKFRLSAALLGAVCTHAYAIETLPDTVVTATRTAQSVDETLASVTVITQEDIARLQAQSLPEVLRGVAGLTISNSGGAGKTTALSLRGTNVDHVLVLVDGIKIGSATTGTASFQDIPVAQIERIEIVRGPRASLYGSEAIGGVIQIFMRKRGGALTPSASFTAGGYGTYSTIVGLSGGGEQGWFNVKVDQQNTKGFNAFRGLPSEPDKDGYHSTSFGVNGGYRFDNGAIADVQMLRGEGRNKFDGAFQNRNDSAQQVLGASLKFSPLSIWNMILRAGSSQDNANNFLNSQFKSRFDTRRDSLTWQNDFALDANQLFTAGLDYQNDNVDSTTVYAKSARNNKAMFGQYQGDFGAHSLQASVRHDNNQQFGGHETGGLGYGYALSDTMRLTASYGTAFKAPTFNQLYYPGFGSATLRPELSRSFELGVAGRDAIGKWSLHAYQTDITDLIAYNVIPPYNIVNISAARLSGLEGQLQTHLAEWELNGTLTLQDPRQTSGANRGKLLNRRATESMRIEAARELGDYRLAGSLYAEGRRFDDMANTPTKALAGYGLIELRAEYRLAADWLLQGRVENLLDKRYETAQFYNQAGRGVYFTLNYRPGN